MELVIQKLVTSGDELLLLLERFIGNQVETSSNEEVNHLVGFDLEGTGVNPGCHHMVGMSLAIVGSSGGEAYYVPLKHEGYSKNVVLTHAHKNRMRSLKVVAYSSMYERKFTLKEWGRCEVGQKDPIQVVGDAKILSRMLQMKVYNLADTAEKLGIPGKKRTDLQEMTGGSYNFGALDPEKKDVLEYALGDAWLALQVEEALRKTLNQKRKEGKYLNWKEIYELELGVQTALADMEAKGVEVNLPALPSIIQKVGDWLEKEGNNIHQQLGSEEKFALNSPKRLSQQLFEAESGPKLEGYEGMKTKSGGYSTAMEHLELLTDQNPVVAQLIEWKHQFAVYTRDLTKVRDWTVGGRVYPSFMTLGEDATGRIYAKDPSITQFSKELRELVVPGEGSEFCHWDWRQAEVRILAIVSDDKKLLSIIESGEDIYKMIAAEVFGKKVAEVTADDRKRAKIVMLAFLYGTQGYSIARILKCSQEEASALLEKLRATFVQVSAWYKDRYNRAEVKGDAYTGLGRRRSVAQEMFKTPDKRTRSKLARSNVNFEIQSYCGGDLLKIAMKKIHDAIQLSPNLRGAYAFCPVFDAVAYVVPKIGKEEFVQVLQRWARFKLQKSGDGYLRPLFEGETGNSNPTVQMEIEVKWSTESWGKVG